MFLNSPIFPIFLVGLIGSLVICIVLLIVTLISSQNAVEDWYDLFHENNERIIQITKEIIGIMDDLSYPLEGGKDRGLDEGNWGEIRGQLVGLYAQANTHMEIHIISGKTRDPRIHRIQRAGLFKKEEE